MAKSKITPYIYSRFKRADMVEMGNLLYNIAQNEYNHGFETILNTIRDGHYIVIKPDAAYEVFIAQKGIGEETANHLVAELERYNVKHLIADGKQLIDDDYLDTINYDEEWQRKRKAKK